MKVTDEMVKAARKAWGDHCATSATTLDDMLRAALEAALSQAAGQEVVGALSRGVPEVEPFVSCTCHEERQKQLCLNKHRCVRAYPLAAIAAQRKEGE